MPNYPLTLTALLAVVQGVSGTHLFRAKLPALQGITKDACVAEVLAKDGMLISCEIKVVSKGSLLFARDRAVSLINEIGELNWVLTDLQERPISDTNPRLQRPPSFLDRRPVCRISSPIPVTLPHKYKRVLAVSDGQRTIEHIARLLHMPYEELQAILRDLQNQQLITF